MNSSIAALRLIISTWRAEQEERRQARAARRSLEQQLATYSTPREVDELLSMIRTEEGAEAEQIRDILTSNLARTA